VLSLGSNAPLTLYEIADWARHNPGAAALANPEGTAYVPGLYVADRKNVLDPHWRITWTSVRTSSVPVP